MSSQQHIARRAQYMAALARANEVRLGRAQIKRDIKSGRMTLVEALREECCESMTVFDLVCAQPRFARSRALRLLGQIGIREGRIVGDMTRRQREAFIAAVGETKR